MAVTTTKQKSVNQNNSPAVLLSRRQIHNVLKSFLYQARYILDDKMILNSSPLREGIQGSNSGNWGFWFVVFFSFTGGKIRTPSYLIVNFNVNCTLNQKLIMHFRWESHLFPRHPIPVMVLLSSLQALTSGLNASTKLVSKKGDNKVQ